MVDPTDWRKEAERLAEALEQIAAPAIVPLSQLPDHGQPNGWRDIAVERIDMARSALSHFQALKDKVGD